ncbi:serine/threonine-protein kinase [uncultured Rhodoferax sp.]|uniref:serine/threonine-protein kinase n=1 Tax=uncultured Rhodoferax sp. TaxID=223188 RepID=UPI0025DE6555|nr:serine/threonine-protein kinase [uncultured Rhodoferax sp.]
MRAPILAASRPSLQVVAGRYQLLRKIGSGGMGAVYLAKQLGVGKQVALKFLPAHLSDDPQLRKRFEREAALTLEVSHPGAAQLLDTGVDEDGHLFLAFEYVEGEDLCALLDREGALPFADAQAIVCKVAETLAFAHARGVVHRDIKPENIRVRRDLAGWHVKVLDFGIARLADEVGTRLTMEGGVAGTPRYMAPEQISASTIDARADIYALGLVLFETLSGREAFDRENTSQLLWAQLNDPVPALVDVQPLRDYPALDALIAQACAKDPAERLQTMQVLITELHALQAPVWWGQPVPVQRRSRPGSAIEGSGEARDPVQLPRPPGRRTFVQLRSSIWWAGAAGVLALGLAAAALWVALDQRAQTRLAQPAIRPAASSPAAPAALTAASALAVPMAPLPLPASSRPVVAVAPVPVAPVSVPVAVAANAAPPASTESVRGEMPECAQLSVYEPPMTRMTVAQLEQRARDVKYLAPSAIANQLQAIKANADSFHPDSRECLYRAMLIRMVLNEKVVLASSPALWGHTRDVPELERLFLEQPLQQDWSLAQRKDVLRQVETLFIANLQKDAPGDDVYWRRMYYGMLFACEATDEARSKAGAKRIPENNCLKLKPTV